MLPIRPPYTSAAGWLRSHGAWALVLVGALCGGCGGGGGSSGGAGGVAVPAIDLAQETATPGIRRWLGRGVNGGSIGLPIATGDLNGDGMADLAIAQIVVDGGPASDRVRSGRITVVFGDGSASGEKDLGSDLSGTLVIEGADPADYAGSEVAFGDVNGDGVDDLLIGIQYDDGPGNTRSQCGSAIVVFGTSTLPALIDLANPPAAGIASIVGVEAGDRLGIFVRTGDVDGDGIADLVLGADGGDGSANGDSFAGEVWVVFGRKVFPAVIDLASSPTSTMSVFGADPGDHLGASCYALDVNDDGFDDVIACAALNRASANTQGFPGTGGADGVGGLRPQCGEVFVVFGGPRASLPASVNLADPATATSTARLIGVDARDTCGEEIALFDLEGNGDLDFVVGALTADGVGNGRLNAGETYVFPASELSPGAVIDLRSPPAGTITIFGASAAAISGDTLRVADFDRDGADDLVVASPGANAGGRVRGGVVHVLYGELGGWPDTIDLLAPPVSLGLIEILAEDAGDSLGYSLAVADLDGDLLPDMLSNVMRGDGALNAVRDTGDVVSIRSTLLNALKP